MKRYDQLLRYLKDNCLGTEVLTFSEIFSICREHVDSDFIAAKSDFERYGFKIRKIDMNARTVLFSREI